MIGRAVGVSDQGKEVLLFLRRQDGSLGRVTFERRCWERFTDAKGSPMGKQWEYHEEQHLIKEAREERTRADAKKGGDPR